MKKICALMIAASFLFTALPMTAGAAQSYPQQKILVQNIAGLQQTLYAEDSSPLSAITIQFLDDILAAGLANNKAALQLAVARYVADVQDIQAIDNQTKCGISFALSTTFATIAMVTDATSGGSAFCIVTNLTNSVADIMSAKTKYDICIIDASATPDEAARAALVTKLKGIETYDFITNAVDVFMCVEAPGAQDYIGLFFNLIGIFTAGK